MRCPSVGIVCSCPIASTAKKRLRVRRLSNPEPNAQRRGGLEPLGRLLP